MPRLVVRFARQAVIAALFIVTALLGTLTGVVFAYSDDLPLISALDDYSPHTITRVLGRDGAVIGEFAVERRTVVTYQQIPDNLRNAIVSAEDANFFDHTGFSMSRMVLALVRELVSRRRTPGGSTITQQLARNLFASAIGFTVGDRSPERKLKELIVALQIEKRYTKQEIFAFYCNQIYWGHGAYGVAAAAQVYFGKQLSELTLEESALIAGIIQSNVRQSPFVNMDAAMRRRNYALERMADEGYVTREQAEEAKKKPIVTRAEPAQDSTIAPYFIEEVRKYVEAKYGAKALYENGLTIRTSLDADLQRFANRAVDQGLRQVARRRGIWRKPARNVLAEGHTLDEFPRRIAGRGPSRPATSSPPSSPPSTARRRRTPPHTCGSAATPPTSDARRISGRGARSRPSSSSPAI